MRGMMNFASKSPAQLPVTEESIDYGEEPAKARDQQLLQEHADHEWADGVALNIHAAIRSLANTPALEQGSRPGSSDGDAIACGGGTNPRQDVKRARKA